MDASFGETRIAREEAHRLVASFLPMFEWLSSQGVSYCVVGGLGVMLQAMRAGFDTFRLTTDADIMFDKSFTNMDFAKAYLQTYAANPEFGQRVYDAVFGYDSFKELSSSDQSLINMSFIGAVEDLDGVSTPDFDVARELNGETLASLEKEEIEFEGTSITVATPHQLELMKRRTIELYHATPTDTARPQDYIDVARLQELQHGGGASQS